MDLEISSLEFTIKFHFHCSIMPGQMVFIVGKDNYLYEESYIKAYLGDDFIGEKKIFNTAQKLKAVQDTLKSNHIDLIVVLAPGKGTFFS